MWLRMALALLLALAVFAVFVQFRPNTYSVQRSISIAAPAENIHPLLSDFHSWSEWSPWEKLDPSMQKTYGGPPSGTGATYAWSGNSEAGAGNMTIEQDAPQKVGIRLEFLKPFPGRSTLTFTLEPEAGGATRVNWNMLGESTFMTKLMGVFTSMDKMVGPDFERGLAQLKTRAEEKK